MASGRIPASVRTGRRTDDKSAHWLAPEVYLSGELGSTTGPTAWLPGESREFILRMNWPGTGSVQGNPLIRADAPGKYAIRIWLVFKAGDDLQYVISNLTKVEVRTNVTPDAAARIPKSPETVLAELRNILPEDWTCTLNRKPGKVAWSEGQFKEPLFRIDFTNLNISFKTNPSPPHGLRGPPHPGLPLYFLPVTEEDRVHWENYGSSIFRRVAESPEYFVVTDPVEVNGGVFSVIGQRSVEPLFRALEKYFGKLASEKTGGLLRVYGHVSDGLTCDSGFAGQVVDDQTGKPIKEFTLEFSTNDPTIPGGRLSPARYSGVLQSASTFFGGQFALEGRNFSMGPLPETGLTFNGDQWWEKGQKVWPQIHADGYLTEPLTPEPVVWPVKLTNIVVRLKRAGRIPATRHQQPRGTISKSAIRNPQSAIGVGRCGRGRLRGVACRPFRLDARRCCHPEVQRA